jgi:hypothetical protein
MRVPTIRIPASHVGRLTMSLMLIGLSLAATDVLAQPGPSIAVSYESYPSSKLSDPGSTPSFLQDLELQVSTFQFDLSYPMVLAEGRHILSHQLQYRRLDIGYRNWDVAQGGTNRAERMHSVAYTLTWMHPLSQKWSLMALATPGIAGELTDDLERDDFYYSAAVVFLRHYRENFTVGYGAAYAPSFGEPLPIPVIGLQWTNGSNLWIDSIVPIRAELRYLHSPRLGLGLLFALDGNQYHGAESKWAPTVNPQLRYSVASFGPQVAIFLPAGLRLNLSGGLTFLRRVEFYDGDTEDASYDLKSSGFIKFGLQFGG